MPVDALQQYRSAGIDGELADLEAGDEFKFRRRELAEALADA